MSKNYTILHLHSMDSNPYSGLEVDSVTPFDAYIPKIAECGMKSVAFTEHGCMLHNVAKKQLCEKNGIKLIQAEEFYVTETLDPENLVRDNWHCLLYAKNKDGVKELLELSSRAFEPDHKYYNPRISLEELENTSDNILILTGCVAGILCKGTNTAKERFLKFIIKNKHRCWLEIQPHDFDLQVQYNRYLYSISIEYGLKLIATSDIHALTEDHMLGRKIMQQSKLKTPFEDEDKCDLIFKYYTDMVDAFRRQQALPEPVYLDALEETNRFAELIEDYSLDYSNKYPRRPNAEDEFKKRINKGIIERGINKLPNYKTEYLPRIKEEFDTYKKNDAIDFMLLDADYKDWMRENGMNYGPSRGSVSGSLIAYLLHNTDVDSVKYELNFSRFMSPDRVSLADVDSDIFKEDRYKVREYFFNREDLYCCNILTFNTIQMRAAIKDVGRALGYTPQQTQEITDENGNDALPDSIIKKYPELIKYVDIVIGTVTSLGRHAAGIVCSPIDLGKAFGTLHISSDPRPVSQVDMHEIDSLNFVKMDLLGLNAVGLISEACKLAEIPYRTMDNTDLNDENVIQSIAKDTTMIFQFESGFASDCLKRMLSPKTIAKIKKKNPNISYLDLFSMVNGVIRPAGESFRDKMLSGEYRDNGNEALNNFLAPTLGYLTYQEQIIDFLHDFCGFTMGQADIVRRCVDENTLITTGFGYQKKIKDLKPGDKVISYNDSGYSEIDTVNKVFDNGIQECFSIKTTNCNELICTETHKVLTQDGFKQVSELSDDDWIMAPSRIVYMNDGSKMLVADYIPLKVKSITPVGERHVYDIEVNKNHNYVADGLIVHNCFAKKTGTEKYIPIIRDGGYMDDIHGNRDERYIKGFVATAQEKYGMSKEEAEDAITYFLQVISDASNYLFSKNHACPYSAIGLFIGWLRYYYPLELFTAALNVYKSNQKKMSNIIAYIKTQGIEVKPIRFGKSRSGYFMDREANCIYQGIESIKECNSDIAEELYELRNNHYETFIDLLKDIDNTSVKKNQLDILIKLEYFKDFGNINYLLKCRDYYDLYNGKVQIKKEAAFESGLDFDLLRECSEKEAPKTFMKLDSDKLIRKLVSKIQDEPTTLREQIHYQNDLLGFINIVDKQYKGMCVVLEVSKEYTPKLLLYALANGNIIQVKIQKKIFNNNPLRKEDIIRIADGGYYKRPKYTKDGDKWIASDTEKEWWITNYSICDL